VRWLCTFERTGSMIIWLNQSLPAESIRARLIASHVLPGPVPTAVTRLTGLSVGAAQPSRASPIKFPSVKCWAHGIGQFSGRFRAKAGLQHGSPWVFHFADGAPDPQGSPVEPRKWAAQDVVNSLGRINDAAVGIGGREGRSKASSR